MEFEWIWWNITRNSTNFSPERKKFECKNSHLQSVTEPLSPDHHLWKRHVFEFFRKERLSKSFWWNQQQQPHIFPHCETLSARQGLWLKWPDWYTKPKEQKKPGWQKRQCSLENQCRLKVPGKIGAAPRAGAPIQDLGFGTWLENLLQWQNLGLLDKIGTFLGPFWDLSGTFCHYFDDTTAKQYRRLKRHIVATFSAKSGLFENHFRTFTGNLDYILINIWRKCLIKYLMQVDIPDHLKPNVFLIRASGRPTGGLYTCNSLIYWNKTEIWDLGGKIGTFLGPF